MDFNFKKIGDIDVSNIKSLLMELKDNIWLESQIRKQIFNELFKETETIELIWDINSFDTNEVGKITEYYYMLNMGSFIEKLKPIYFQNYGDGHFVRILLVKMKKNTNIKPHIDTGKSLTICHRTHIPIITNKLVFFTVNDETKNLNEGEIWEISNQKIHSLKNESDMDRIHLILDYYAIPNIKSKILI